MPSSKLVTSAAVGAVHVTGDKIDEYLYQQDFPVLGHMINNAGSIATAFRTTVRKIWKAFLGNAGSRGKRTLGQRRKALLISRSVQPLFEFQCARWPAQITYLMAIDVVQRKMIALSFGLRRRPGDTAHTHNMRCARVAAGCIDVLGFQGHPSTRFPSTTPTA